MKEEAHSTHAETLLPADTENVLAVPACTDALDRYIGHVRSLPPAPVIATQLLALFGEADRDIDRIVELIGLDPSLTAEVLKRSNSAYVGLAQPVRDMFEAVFQLGFYEVFCIVVASVGSRSMLALQTEGGMKTEVLWQHSVGTAVASSALAKRVQATEASAFTAGLLHDIGKLVLASVERGVYANLMRDAAAAGTPLVMAEEITFGFNHAGLGARLLERWNFPAEVCAAVRHHHSASGAEATSQPLPAIVTLGNELSHQVLAEPGQSAEISAAGAEALTLLGLAPADLPTLLEATRSDLQQVEGLLQIRA